MNPNTVQLTGMSKTELLNLKEAQLAQIELNVANAKVQADRLLKQNTAIESNVAKIDEAIASIGA